MTTIKNRVLYNRQADGHLQQTSTNKNKSRYLTIFTSKLHEYLVKNKILEDENKNENKNENKTAWLRKCAELYYSSDAQQASVHTDEFENSIAQLQRNTNTNYFSVKEATRGAVLTAFLPCILQDFAKYFKSSAFNLALFKKDIKKLIKENSDARTKAYLKLVLAEAAYLSELRYANGVLCFGGGYENEIPYAEIKKFSQELPAPTNFKPQYFCARKLQEGILCSTNSLSVQQKNKNKIAYLNTILTQGLYYIGNNALETIDWLNDCADIYHRDIASTTFAKQPDDLQNAIKQLQRNSNSFYATKATRGAVLTAFLPYILQNIAKYVTPTSSALNITQLKIDVEKLLNNSQISAKNINYIKLLLAKDKYLHELRYVDGILSLGGSYDNKIVCQTKKSLGELAQLGANISYYLAPNTLLMLKKNGRSCNYSRDIDTKIADNYSKFFAVNIMAMPVKKMAAKYIRAPIDADARQKKEILANFLKIKIYDQISYLTRNILEDIIEYKEENWYLYLKNLACLLAKDGDMQLHYTIGNEDTYAKIIAEQMLAYSNDSITEYTFLDRLQNFKNYINKLDVKDKKKLGYIFNNNLNMLKLKRLSY